MKKLIFFLAFATTAACANGMENSKTPEQVTDLYIAAMMGDVDSAKTINDYLRAAWGGKDHLDMDKIPVLLDEVKTNIAEKTLRVMSSNQDSNEDNDAINKAALAYAQASVDELRHSTCHATGSRIRPNTEIPGEFVAEVAYACRVPDGAAVLELLGMDRHLAPTTQELEELAAALSAAPADKTITGTLDLYSKAKHGVWYTNRPAEILSAILKKSREQAE